MINAILSPFLDVSRASARAKGVWLVVLLGALPALWVAGWLDAKLNTARDFKLELDREAVLSRTRQFAAAYEVDVTGWSEYVAGRNVQRNEQFRRVNAGKLGPMADRFVPRMEITVLLVRPDRQMWLRTRFSERTITGFQWGGEQLRFAGAPPGSGNPREQAEESWRRLLGERAPKSEPVIEHAENEAGMRIERGTWREDSQTHPELQYELLAEVGAGRVLRQEIRPQFDETFVREKLGAQDTNMVLFGTISGILQVCFIFYACYRYARRSLEREAPHGRALTLAGIIFGLGVLVAISAPFASVADLSIEQVSGSAMALLMFGASANILLQGITIGVSYGAGEGEVREAFPQKLTSLDALLSKRFLAQNVGVSVLGGAAMACWLTLMNRGLLVLADPGQLPVPYTIVMPSLSKLPLLPSLVYFPLVGFFSAVLGLLMPLTLLRRHVKSKRWFLVLLFALALLLTNVSGSPVGQPTVYAVNSVSMAVLVVGTFFAFDFLAAVVALVIVLFAITVGDLKAAMAYWQNAAWMVNAGAGALLLPLAWACWKGRRCDDREVRPQHAQNLAERLSLQAELSLAREAQLRLLPDRTPVVPGMSVAASCTPAGEVGGDFYDFYDLRSGELGVFVAEGGNDGLASALTIALAKGFLMYESSHSSNPVEVLGKLEEALGTMLRRDSGRTSIAMLVVDVDQRRLRLARVGAYPLVMVLRSTGAVDELEPIPVAGEISYAEKWLDARDTVVLVTDGVQKQLARQAAGGPQEFLRRVAGFAAVSSAEGLHDALLRTLIGEERSSDAAAPQDDLTAVVLHFEPSQARDMERVA